MGGATSKAAPSDAPLNLSNGRRRPPSSTSGGVYEGQIVDSGLDLGLAVIDLGSRFFVIKN
jgi:hypothetical protein